MIDAQKETSLDSARSDDSSINLARVMPNDILAYIFAFLSGPKLAEIAHVCRNWKSVSETDRLWMIQCEKLGILATNQSQISWKLHYRNQVIERCTNAIKDSSPTIQTWGAHEQRVNRLLVRDGMVIACSYKSNEIRAWKLQYAQLLYTLAGRGDNITCLEVSRRFVISASNKQVVQIWNRADGKELSTLQMQDNDNAKITALHAKGHLLMCGSCNGMLTLWSLRDFNHLNKYAGHTNQIYCIRSAKDRWITSADDRSIRIWALQSGQCLNELVVKAATDSLQHMVVYPAAHLFVATNHDSELVIWDGKSKKAHYLQGHKAPIEQIEQQHHLLISRCECSVVVWDICSQSIRHIIKAAQDRESFVSFSLMEYAIVIATEERLQFWHLHNTGAKQDQPFHTYQFMRDSNEYRWGNSYDRMLDLAVSHRTIVANLGQIRFHKGCWLIRLTYPDTTSQTQRPTCQPTDKKR